MNDEELPAKTVCLILLAAEILGGKQNHRKGFDRKTFFTDGSL